MEDLSHAGPCPKGCGRESRYEADSPVHIWQVCSCGYRRLAYYKNEDGIITKRVQSPEMAKLPKKGTRLSNCLIAVAAPGQATTGDVARKVGLPTGDAATQLTILSCRGLVEKTVDNKGVSGGSTWVLTDTAKRLLQIK